jgi:hypothetical protein
MSDAELDTQFPQSLERLGFTERWQSTTDCMRLVEWWRDLPCWGESYTHRVTVLYQAYISDDPRGSWPDCIDWEFLGVYLKSISVSAMHSYEDWLKEYEGMVTEEEDVFRTAGCVCITKLDFKKRSELRRLIKLAVSGAEEWAPEYDET